MRLKTKLAALAAGATMLAATSASATVLLVHASGVASGPYAFIFGGNEADTYTDVPFSMDVTIDLSMGTRTEVFFGPLINQDALSSSGTNPGEVTETVDGHTITGARTSTFQVDTDGVDGISQFLGTLILWDGLVTGFWVQQPDPTLFKSYETLPSGNLCVGATLCTAELSAGSDQAIKAPLDTLTVTELPVPEPTSWTLMLIGFGGLGGMLRRRRAFGASGLN
jgi:hypothetical protein